MHKLLLAGCANFHPKRFLNSLDPFSSRLGGTRTLSYYSRPAEFCPTGHSVPHGNVRLGSFSRNYSDVCLNSLVSQALPLSTCQTRRSQCAAVRTGRNLLQRGAVWPGKMMQFIWLILTTVYKYSMRPIVLFTVMVKRVSFSSKVLCIKTCKTTKKIKVGLQMNYSIFFLTKLKPNCRYRL